MVKRSRRTLHCLITVALAVVLLLPTQVVLSAARSEPGRFDKAGLRGSGQAFMQPTNVGLRVALVGSIPGSGEKEAWAVGTSSAKIAGWAGDVGQTVFLKYTRGSGWVIKGPPKDGSGNPVNPRLTSIGFTGDGTGWAVGDNGSLLRRDGDDWILQPKARGLGGEPISTTLLSVSLLNDGGSVVGFALGEGPTILRLTDGSWVEESFPEPPSGSVYDLVAISASARNHAWAAGSTAGSLLVFRRTDSGWDRVNVGDEPGESFFDEPGVRQVDGMPSPVSSTPGVSVSATGGGAWVGGTIVPVADARGALGDPVGDVTRPFAIFFPSSSGDNTTYCPDEYGLDSNRKSVTRSVCEKPFPRAAFGLSAMRAFESGESFAGGLGMFHFKDGAWFREENPVGYIASITFTDPNEGWIAGTGNTFGAPSAVSSVGTLGHWTRARDSERVARWPLPPTDPSTRLSYPVEDVAIAPDGSGRALAVGQRGSTYIFQGPEAGWEAFESLIDAPLHGVSWPAANAGWAVGGLGTILFFDGSKWSFHPQTARVVRSSLFGVAFSSPQRGFAVGGNGLILKYAGGRWSKDPASGVLTSDDLYAIDHAGGDFIAVGANGTVLSNNDGNWRRENQIERLLTRGGVLPALFAVDGLADGTVLVGGELSTLIRREDGRWSVDTEGSRVPPEGTILAIGARRVNGRIELLASVSYERMKYSGETPGVVTGFLMYGTGRGWRDLEHSTRLTTYPSLEASATRDPVLALEVSGNKAWAVGGLGEGNDDGQGHVASFPTGSIYRVDLGGDPRPGGFRITPMLDEDPSTITFAFFGESACGRGLCSATAGTGTKADVVPLQIRDEINEMARLGGGPKFALFGGSMRRTGIPEEIGEFKKYADGFRIPFFAALGATDVFSDLSSAVVDETRDYDQNNLRQFVPDVTDATFFLEAMNDRFRPWGKRAPPRGIVPVEIGGFPKQDQARTHYAFDYIEGNKRLRIVVLDSTGNRMNPTNTSTQNPEQDQVSWLEAVLRDGRDKGAISIVVMNRPLQNPLEVGLAARPHPDFATVQGAVSVASLHGSALLSSFFRQNALDVLQIPGVASTLPIYVFGGGGAPLEATIQKPPDPAAGYYHSYQLVTVNFDPARRIPPLDRAEVYVRSYPVLDHVAMTARDGLVVEGGDTLRFTGTGRVVEGGGPGDPLQSRASVLPLDIVSAGVCPPDPNDSNRPKCSRLSGGPIGPTFLYLSDNPAIGTFVAPSPIVPELPYQHPQTGLPVPDSTSGLFCAFKAGETYVSLVSGFHRARMKVTVTGGSGPCVRAPVPGIDLPRAPFVPALQYPLAAARPTLIAPPPFDIPPVGIVVPPFVPILAPAPPAAGGYARREQHKQATEEQGSEFRAIPRTANRPLGALSSQSTNRRQAFTAIQKERSFRATNDPLLMMLSALIVAMAVGLSIGVVMRTRREPGFLLTTGRRFER